MHAHGPSCHGNPAAIFHFIKIIVQLCCISDDEKSNKYNTTRRTIDQLAEALSVPCSVCTLPC